MLPVLDIFLLIGTLVLFFVVGILFRQRDTSTSSDYFLAGKKMNPIPAAFSISVSFLSSVSLTLFIGEVYKYGFPIYLMAVASVVVAPIITILIQHLFFDKPYLSVYQYFEDRFSKSVKIVNSLIFITAGLINSGVVGYAAAISAETLAEIPFWISALAIGLISTIYSTIGGIKAVIWTDVIQALLMLSFFVIILAKALCSSDSLNEFWNLASSGHRTELNFQEGPSHRYSFQSTFLRYIIFLMFDICISQPGVQRWKSVPTLREARLTAIVSLSLFGIFSLLIFFTGLALFSFYARCSVSREALPKAVEKVSLHFVATELSSWDGVIGLALAGILSGALSTISSLLNSFAAVTLEDFVRIKFVNLTQRQELSVSKALTAAYGLISMALIFLVATQSKMAVMIQASAVAVATAPVLGVFFLGIWSKRANSLGVSLGMTFSVGILLWMSIGSFMEGRKHLSLPLDNAQCLRNSSTFGGHLKNQTTQHSILKGGIQNSFSSFLYFLYNISFVWYYFIGFSTSVILGYFLSLFGPICTKMFKTSSVSTKSTEHIPDNLSNSFRTCKKDVRNEENENLVTKV